jgi:hypothetical protein
MGTRLVANLSFNQEMFIIFNMSAPFMAVCKGVRQLQKEKFCSQIKAKTLTFTIKVTEDEDDVHLLTASVQSTVHW